MTPTQLDTTFENPEDRLDLLQAELRIWIDRVRAVLRVQTAEGDPLLPYAAALRQVDLIEHIVFEQAEIGETDGERVNLDAMALRAFDASPDETTTVLLTNVAATFRFIDARAWPSHRVLSRRDENAPWGPDAPRPLQDRSLIDAGKEAAFSLSLAYVTLVQALRAIIDPSPMVPIDAHARADEVWAADLLRSLARDYRLFRRASRLALLGDPSEIAFLSRANARTFENTARAWGLEWIRVIDDEALGGSLQAFDVVANQAAAELARVPAVYDRPLPPPTPSVRDIEFALYRLALAHDALLGALAEALPLSAPWTDALAAFEAGAIEIERALLAALDDPTPRYRLARNLGQRWAKYDALVHRLPLDTLSSATRGALVERAKTIAVRARALSEATQNE